MGLGHLLKNRDEESNLNLSRLLQESVQGSGPLRFAQHTEPLLDGAELVLELLIQCSRSHLLQRILVRLQIVDPLAGRLVEGLGLGVLLGYLGRIQEYLGRRPDAPTHRRLEGTRHVGRGSQVVPGPRSRGSQRSAVRRLFGLVEGGHGDSWWLRRQIEGVGYAGRKPYSRCRAAGANLPERAD